MLQHLRMKCAHSLNGSYLYPKGKALQDHSLSHLFTRTLRREPVNGCSARCWAARSLNPSNLFMILLLRKLVVSRIFNESRSSSTKNVGFQNGSPMTSIMFLPNPASPWSILFLSTLTSPLGLLISGCSKWPRLGNMVDPRKAVWRYARSSGQLANYWRNTIQISPLWERSWRGQEASHWFRCTMSWSIPTARCSKTWNGSFPRVGMRVLGWPTIKEMVTFWSSRVFSISCCHFISEVILHCILVQAFACIQSIHTCTNSFYTARKMYMYWAIMIYE